MCALALFLRPVPTAVANYEATMPAATIGLGSLLFDFEVEERTPNPGNPVPPARVEEQLLHNKEILRFFSAPDSSYSSKLLRDVRCFLKEEYDTDAILLATKLAAVGYCVNVRTALGGGTSCFRNLRHEFLTVRGQGDFDGIEFIVEPRFREHFLISHPSDAYSELLNHAPDVFVGTGGRLVPIVQTLCEAMAASFESKGLTLPPWRRTQAMLSKWLPNRARDVSFSRASAPQHGPALAPASPPQSRHRHATPSAVGTCTGTTSPSAAPFARISDPLFARNNSNNRTTVKAITAENQNPEGGDDWAIATQGFIPFGGAGGCSSDTETPSPPAAAAGFAAPADGGPMGRPAPCSSSSSVRRVVGQGGSLLASRLQRPPAAAAAGQQGPSAQSHYLQCNLQPGVLPTRPPAHWGEAPIHRVRMGFQVMAAAATAAPYDRGQGEHKAQAEPAPERPAAPKS